MQTLESYRVVWDSQSQNSGESMPVGGHDTGLNAWVENGDILFLIDRSGSFDENNQMLKLGRVRINLDPNPFVEGVKFSQELVFLESYLEIKAVAPGGLETKVTLWVDVFNPVVHIEVEANQPVKTTFQYENWRLEDVEVPDVSRDSRMAMMSLVTHPDMAITRKDTVEFSGDDVLFYHRNRSDDLVFDKVVEAQNLKPYQDRMWNPQINNTFGGLLRGQGLKPAGNTTGTYVKTAYQGWKLTSETPVTYQHAALYLNTSQAATLEDWLGEVQELVNQTENSVETQKEKSREWWRNFWERSFIAVDPAKRLDDPQPWQVGRNYNLFRYMLACNAFGEYPTKFNGGLFTSDPSYVLPGPEWEQRTPDFRRWGGGSFTAQNQRLVYWPMLKSGDFELMPPQFEFYRRGLVNAELRTRVYWGHAGCSFTEQIENFGLPLGWAWGWYGSGRHPRNAFTDPTEQTEPYVKYLYLQQLDFSFMIMKYHLYSGIDISQYIPFIESSLKFFDEHYQYIHFEETDRRLGKDGKLVLFPSTACETYKMALNPTDLVAALDATIRAVLALPEKYISEESKTYYRGLLDRIPPFTYREKEGKRTLAPAESWKEIINVEIPQLYPVFPYEQYGLGRPDLQTAIDTWHYGTDIPEQKNHISWHQDGIFCARMGLTEEAAAIAIRKLGDGDKRFPAFWGPGHDWLPDHNWGGTGMTGLQEMLLQTNGEAIYLLPAWPRDWDVDFKLHAPAQTVVEGRVRNGKLETLTVTPPERLADVVNLWEMPLE